MILLNEELIKADEVNIHMEDRGYQFGDGVYEVIRVYDGDCFEMDAHLERLVQSADKIRMSLAYPISDLKQNLIALVEKNSLTNGTIYIQVTRGVAPRTHHFPTDVSSVLVAYVQDLDRPSHKTNNGAIAILAEDIRWKRCDIKSLNLLGSVLSKQEAKERGCEEAILHRGGIITEGSSTNVFLIKDRVIYTHPADHYILNGITRKKVMQIAQDYAIQLKEQPFTTKELLQADEIFMTSTTLEITPIIQIDDKQIGNGEPESITRRIQQGYEEEIWKERVRGDSPAT